MTDPIHAQLDALDRLRAEARLKGLAEALTGSPVSGELVAQAITEANAPAPAIPSPAPVVKPLPFVQAARWIGGRVLGTALGVAAGLLAWAGFQATPGLEVLPSDLDTSWWWEVVGTVGLASVGVWAWALRQKAPPITSRKERVINGLLVGFLGVAFGYMGALRTTAQVELHTDIGTVPRLSQDITAFSATNRAVQHALGQDAPGSVEAQHAVAAPQCDLAQKEVIAYVRQPATVLGLVLRGGLVDNLYKSGCISAQDRLAQVTQFRQRAQAQVSRFDALPKPAFLNARPFILASVEKLNSRERWCQVSPEWPQGTNPATPATQCAALPQADLPITHPMSLRELGIVLPAPTKL